MMTVEKRHEKDGDTPDLFMLTKAEFRMLLDALRFEIECSKGDRLQTKRFKLMRKLERCLEMEDKKA